MTALAKHCEIVLNQAQRRHYAQRQHTVWTKELDDQAANLLDSGMSIESAANKLGVIPIALERRRRMLEATKEKRQKMVDMWKTGMSFSAVGRALGVHKNTVKRAVELA